MQIKLWKTAAYFTYNSIVFKYFDLLFVGNPKVKVCLYYIQTCCHLVEIPSTKSIPRTYNIYAVFSSQNRNVTMKYKLLVE